MQISVNFHRYHREHTHYSHTLFYLKDALQTNGSGGHELLAENF